jgi:hypothetical protein
MDFKFVKEPSQQKGGQPKVEPKEEQKLDVAAIPDIEKLLGMVLDLLRYISTEEMQRLEETDSQAFERHLDSKFETLSLRYYSIFKLLLDKENREENIFKLINMFSILKEVKSGSLDITKADEDMQLDLYSEYVDPKIGGKEEFERVLKAKRKLEGR